MNWKAKLSSRKFWALIAALVVSCLTAFGAAPGTIANTTGVVAAAGACAMYMLAEGIADSKKK